MYSCSCFILLSSSKGIGEGRFRLGQRSALANFRLKEPVAPGTANGVLSLDTGEAQGVATEGAAAKDVGLAVANTGKKEEKRGGQGAERGRAVFNCKHWRIGIAKGRWAWYNRYITKSRGLV